MSVETLVQKIITFSDVRQFSDCSFETKSVTKSSVHCIDMNYWDGVMPVKMSGYIIDDM